MTATSFTPRIDRLLGEIGERVLEGRDTMDLMRTHNALWVMKDRGWDISAELEAEIRREEGL
jgi:hypothetical protein